jgi:hypothetical protein
MKSVGLVEVPTPTAMVERRPVGREENVFSGVVKSIL